MKQTPTYVYLLVFAVLLTIIVLGTGCHIQQRIEAAVKIDRLEHPCINDTATIIAPGMPDIYEETNFIHDTTYLHRPDTIRITRTIRRTDTIKRIIIDNYLINAWKDSVVTHKRTESYLQGQIIEKEAKYTQEAKKSQKWTILFFSILTLNVTIIAVRLYLKFKPL